MAKGTILDSSAILRSNLDFTAGGFYITNGVLAEIADPTARAAIDYGIRSSRIKIIEPAAECVERARGAASKTGDAAGLSDVDVGVIAAALQNGLDVASDDYAVQNTCSALGVGFKATTHDGIKSRVEWMWVCGGCGRGMGGPGECGVCGHGAKRRRRGI